MDNFLLIFVTERRSEDEKIKPLNRGYLFFSVKQRRYITISLLCGRKQQQQKETLKLLRKHVIVV